MSEIVIYTAADRDSVIHALLSIPQEARGGSGIARDMMVDIGTVALNRIRDAFVVKSSGGTDAAGDRWTALSLKTIAYSRRGGRTRIEKRRPDRPSQALTSAQRNRWWRLYRGGLGMYRGNKGAAAKRAWAIIKSEGATTLFAKYSGRSASILQDSGLLLKSLTPGEADSVFRVLPGEVIVGTSRKGAVYHHAGIPGRLPQRRLWPSPAKWPSAWWQDILKQSQVGLTKLAVEIVGRL